MDFYNRLREMLDTHPAGAPPSAYIDRILRILFTPEEAETACSLTFRLQSLSRLVRKTGRDMEALERSLENMADKGVIMAERNEAGEYCYSLLPTVPGLFEFPFMRAERLPQREELSRLWRLYHNEALGNAFASSPTPQVRVIPGKRSLQMVTEVLNYEQVANMISQAADIAVTNCSCRSSMQKCDHPLEVCLAFDRGARFLAERQRARMIDRDEALRVLDSAEEAGLVHCISNSREGPIMLCNCCSCCCGILRGITELHNPYAIAVSSFVVDFNASECIGCFLCSENRCPVAAVVENGDIVSADSSICIGCGLCVSVCPTGALAMKPRRESAPPPKTYSDLFTTVLREKGLLKDFVRLNRG